MVHSCCKEHFNDIDMLKCIFKERKSTKDKANISNPKVNRGAPLTTKRTLADCVQISLGPSIPHIPLGVYHTGVFNAMYTGTLATGIEVRNKTDALLPNKRILYIFRSPHRYNGITTCNSDYRLQSITAAHIWELLKNTENGSRPFSHKSHRWPSNHTTLVWKYPVISWPHRVNISSSNGLVSTTTNLCLNQWQPKFIQSQMTAWTHIYSPKLNKTIKGVHNPTILLNLSWNNFHVLTAPWNIWQLTERPAARVWACMCGVNNVNLPVIYGKLRQSTLTLTDYRFSTSLTK